MNNWSDRVYDVAAALLAVAEEDDDDTDEENERTRNAWFAHWRKHLPTFQVLPHDGDCVGVPMGCSRCLHDAYVEDAKKMINNT
jgi:hypothetical protein